MPNEVKQLDGGKLEVKLETGETFTGDPLEVANKMAEAHVNTKRWGQNWHTKYEEAAQAINQPIQQPAPQPAADPNEAQLQKYLLDQTARALGYSSADEYRADLQKVKQTTEIVQNQAVASTFLQSCPDFPNTDEAIKGLGDKMTQLGADFTPLNMIAAHTMCVRENRYKALTPDEVNSQWANEMAASSRQGGGQPTPPPMLGGSSPDARAPETTLWNEPLDKMRARILSEQRAGKQ